MRVPVQAPAVPVVPETYSVADLFLIVVQADPQPVLQPAATVNAQAAATMDLLPLVVDTLEPVVQVVHRGHAAQCTQPVPALPQGVLVDAPAVQVVQAALVLLSAHRVQAALEHVQVEQAVPRVVLRPWARPRVRSDQAAPRGADASNTQRAKKAR